MDRGVIEDTSPAGDSTFGSGSYWVTPRILSSNVIGKYNTHVVCCRVKRDTDSPVDSDLRLVCAL